MRRTPRAPGLCYAIRSRTVCPPRVFFRRSPLRTPNAPSAGVGVYENGEVPTRQNLPHQPQYLPAIRPPPPQAGLYPDFLPVIAFCASLPIFPVFPSVVRVRFVRAARTERPMPTSLMTGPHRRCAARCHPRRRTRRASHHVAGRSDGFPRRRRSLCPITLLPRSDWFSATVKDWVESRWRWSRFSNSVSGWRRSSRIWWRSTNTRPVPANTTDRRPSPFGLAGSSREVRWSFAGCLSVSGWLPGRHLTSQSMAASRAAEESPE